MTDSPFPSRRRLLQAGGAFGLAMAAGPLLTTRADAATAEAGTTTVTDLGPGLVQFSLMSGLMVGDTVYIGSRNLNPSRVIGFHLPSRKVVSHTELDAGPEPSIQALAADPTGRYLYIGVLLKADQGKPNLYRWDLTTPDEPAVAVGRTEDRDIRDLAVAPDGMVYAVGGMPDKPPVLWEYDPATGTVVNLGTPDPNATLARAVAATRSTVFFGAGSILAGGGGASKASLYAYDRATRTFTSVVPKEMEKDPSLRELAVIGGNLVVGTSGGVDPAKFAVMDLADLSQYTVVTTQGKTVKSFSADADRIYFASEAGVQAYSTAEKTISPWRSAGLTSARSGVWTTPTGSWRSSRATVSSPRSTCPQALRWSPTWARRARPPALRQAWGSRPVEVTSTWAATAPSPGAACGPAKSSICGPPARPRTRR